MPDLLALTSFLDALLETNTYPDAEDTLYRHSLRPVARLGLAVEANFDVTDWVNANHLDAVFLHRPWKVDDQPLPPDIGVLMSHLPFDDHLTLGSHPRLARVLGIADWEPFGDKAGRPLGMVGHIASASFDAVRRLMEDVFDGVEHAQPGTTRPITTVAVVNAMTDALVREAAARGAQVYVTGQERVPARAAVEETGVGIVAVGHERCEQWGLRVLAGLLRERWAGLETWVRAA